MCSSGLGLHEAKTELHAAKTKFHDAKTELHEANMKELFKKAEKAAMASDAQAEAAKKSDPYARPESRAGSACQLTQCEAGDDPTKYTSCEASLQYMWDQLQNVPWLMRPSVTCAEGRSMMVKDLCPSCKACTEADMCS